MKNIYYIYTRLKSSWMLYRTRIDVRDNKQSESKILAAEMRDMLHTKNIRQLIIFLNRKALNNFFIVPAYVQVFNFQNM
jgi:hypothetical protein